MLGVMRLLSWICHGLKNPWTSRSFRKIVREQALTVFFLMETPLDKEGFEKLYGKLPFLNRIIVKHPDSRGRTSLDLEGGGIAGCNKFYC